jgi:hypothetical protein
MYKTFALAILLLPTFTFAQEAKPTSAPVPLTTPQIVAKGKLRNQTANIPITTIFTPSADGFYRLSAYSTETIPVVGSQNYWNFSVYWTDDGGSQVNGPMSQEVGGGYGSDGYPSGTVCVFDAKAGQAISFSMSLSDGTDGGTYSLYYTLERLE